MTDDFFLKKKDEPEIIPLDEMFKGKYKELYNNM